MRILGPFLVAATLLAQPGTKSVVTVRVSKKVALVIGNSAYRHIPAVPPASADADDIARALTALGFEVTTRKNLDKEAVIQEVSAFARTRVQPGGLALLYYSGHGGQIGEENYLLPVDYAPPSDDELVDARAYKMSRVRDTLERTGARVRVMIFDACRNSPVTTAKSSGTGLREMNGKSEGTIIAYASGHNQVARYETGERNSFYTAELLAALRQPGDHLKGLFEQVQSRVFERTKEKQTPYLYGFLSGPVYLGGEPVAKVEAPVAAPAVDLAAESWRLIQDSKDPAVFERFAGMFPRHELAKVALARVSGLRAVARVESAPSPPRRYAKREGAVWIEPGSFLMGCSPGDGECYSDEANPPNLVEIAHGFWMKETEVTQAEYERVMGDNPSHFRGPNRPVERVDWNAAKAYCAREGGRLPSAAEWEYAARAGTTGARHGDFDNIAWSYSNSNGQTHEVRGHYPNPWGLYDMLGNVLEWTADNYDVPIRELRGGSWSLEPGYLRASDRYWLGPTSQDGNTGFRCVWD